MTFIFLYISLSFTLAIQSERLFVAAYSFVDAATKIRLALDHAKHGTERIRVVHRGS